jgi:transcription factor WhiB
VDVLTAMMRAMPWEHDAACRDTGIEHNLRGTWIIEPNQERAAPASIVRKLEICDSCPVRPECLRYALEATFGAWGVWGGTTGVERTALVPRPRQADLAYTAERRTAVRTAEKILTASHDERLARWRRFAVEERQAHKANRPFKVTYRRIQGPLKAALAREG